MFCSAVMLGRINNKRRGAQILPMISKKIAIIIVLICLVAAYAINSSIPAGYAVEETYVSKVVDGDTIVVGGGQRVRLLSMDTRERGENCYDEAKQRLEELVLLKNITLERDKEDKDHYDRLLRYVYIDGISINIQMVREGLAVAYIYEPNVKYRDEFAAAEQAARSEGGCVWTTQP